VRAADVRPFRCARGHAFDALGLLNEHSRRAEEIRVALGRVLDEGLSFSRRLAERAEDEGRRELRLYLERKGAETRAWLDFLRGSA
jgi:hypothetical protein